MIRASLVASVALTLASPAWAMQTTTAALDTSAPPAVQAAAPALRFQLLPRPEPSATPPAPDPNIRSVVYDPMQRVRIINTVGHVTNITYDKHENIVRVVLGDPEMWEGPKPEDTKGAILKNNLPLWARKPDQTNLVVTTEDENGEQHPYQYSMVSRPAQDEDDPAATYGLFYSYPARARAQAAQHYQVTLQASRGTWSAALGARRQAAALAKIAADTAAAGKNYAYTGTGDRLIAPRSDDRREIWDDGQDTFLRYQGASSLPAPFYSPDNSMGAEESVPFSMTGDTMVVHKVVHFLHLRLGAAVVYVTNRAYNAVGVNPATGKQADPLTGTSSPHVERTIRGASLP